MKEITLQANIRTARGRSASNTLRRAGTVPGVFYLHNDVNIPIEVKLLDLRPLVYTAETHIIDLQLSDGTNQKCVMREVQFDPLTDTVTHFDLMGLVMDRKLRVEVPVVLHGSAIGLREGGVLNHLMHKIEVECFPADLPEHIVVDISDMAVGDMRTVAHLHADNVVFHADPDVPVVAIAHSRHEEAPAAPTEEAPAEPEVIARGKAEEED